MEASKVIEACEKVIEHIKSVQETRNRESINSVMGHIMEIDWWKFKFIRVSNDEQAIKYLNDENMFGWRSLYKHNDLDHAEKLLKLAKNGDPVTLNENDCDVLF